MEVTEVRIRIVDEDNAERLRAFATITLDNEFLVRDMKVIEGNNGIFVAMPSRKITERCVACGAKNYARANYCNECGKKAQPRNTDGPIRTHIDIAHPITQDCRKKIHRIVIEEYEKKAKESSKQQASQEAD